jgi:hypothetical protein
VLTSDAIRLGIAKLNRRIAALEAFDPQSVEQRDAPEVQAIETAISQAIVGIFGNGTFEHRQYRDAATLDQGPRVMQVQPDWIAARSGGFGGHRGDDLREVHGYLADGKRRSLVLLRQAVGFLEEELLDRGETVDQATLGVPPTTAPAPMPPAPAVPVEEAPIPVAAMTEIRDVVGGLKAELPTLTLSNSERSEITADIVQIEAEADRPAPRRRFMKMYLESLRDNLAKAAGAATVTAVVALGAILAKYFGLL